MPCCSVGGMACITLRVRPSCVGSLAPRPKLGQGADCARGWSFGQGGDCARDPGLGRDGVRAWGLRGRARRSLRPRPKGLGETESAPEAREVERSSYSFLLLFIPLVWVSYFMVPNTLPRDVVALPLPFPSSAKATPPSPSLSPSFLLCSPVRQARHSFGSGVAGAAPSVTPPGFGRIHGELLLAAWRSLVAARRRRGSFPSPSLPLLTLPSSPTGEQHRHPSSLLSMAQIRQVGAFWWQIKWGGALWWWIRPLEAVRSMDLATYTTCRRSGRAAACTGECCSHRWARRTCGWAWRAYPWISIFLFF